MFCGNNNDGVNNLISDLLNVISIMLGYENLMENREQSAQNNVAKHNQKQAEFILNDLHKRLDYQNKLLEEILKILKGEKEK